MSERLPIVDALLGTDPAGMAGLLLRAPDAVILEHQLPILAACRAQRFTAGAQFVDVRTAALCTLRDRVGRLPDRQAAQLEHWRAAFAALALRTGR